MNKVDGMHFLYLRGRQLLLLYFLEAITGVKIRISIAYDGRI